MVMGMQAQEVSREVVGESRKAGKAKTVSTSKGEAKIVSSGTKKKAASKSKKAKKDDLTKIEGIGPKIAGLLNADGITTFEQLADAKVTRLRKILNDAGPRYQMHDPATWPKQSKLAAKGDWDKLKKLQDELDGGK